mgnify:CR=1 FL=1
MYKYECPGSWWGTYKGLRNVYTNDNLSDDQAITLAHNDIRKSMDAKNCRVTLLVKYNLSIDSVKAYADITKIPFSQQSKVVKKLDLD